MNCISSAGAQQFVNFPTRLSSNCSSSSLIDYVYFSFGREKLNVNVVDYGISDHMLVICEIRCLKNKNVNYQKSVQHFS